MHKTVGVHRVNNAVQVGCRFVVVEERMQQAALVPATVSNRANHREARRTVAVNFAVHAKRLGGLATFRVGEIPHTVGTGT